MESVNIVLHIISLVFAMLAASLLLFVNQERKHSNTLLAFVLLAFALQHLVLFLLFSKWILHAPWLLRVAGPSTFLIGPAACLYIRSVLHDEMQYRKYDWLFLVPAFLALVNFVPYYLLSNQEKIELLYQSFYNNPRQPDSGRGLLPSPIYYSFRALWSGFCIWLGYSQLFRFRKDSSAALLEGNKILIRWLFTFNGLLTAILLAVLAKLFIVPMKNSPVTVSDVLIAVTVVFICLQLFLRPHILYGVHSPLSLPLTLPDQGQLAEITESAVPQLVSLAEGETTAIPIQFTPTDHESKQYKQIIELYFRERKPYLDTDFSLEKAVEDIRIPRYILSAFINRQYGLGFREFINRHRIEYFIENKDKEEWKLLTLEAIASHCGFGSRSTFIRSFKQYTGYNPSDFLKKT